jgi:hypothetical protein
VCKTCSDYKHVCLGYSESTAHLRSQSNSASRAPGPPLAGQRDPNNQHTSRAVESSSPEPPPGSLVRSKPDKSPQVPKQIESKDASSRDTSARTNKEDSQTAVDTPESSKISTKPLPSLPNFTHCDAILTKSILLRSHLFELPQSHPCAIFQIFWTHGYRAWFQTNGLFAGLY